LNVLFACIHHKRSLLFEEGVKKLVNEGFPIILQNTGNDNGFGNFGLAHPNIEFINNQIHTDYDTGLMNFKDILRARTWDIVHFIDNDLFITNMDYIKETLKDFAESDFGYASHLENGNGYDLSRYHFKGTMAEVFDQDFEPSSQPGGIKGKPQWENAAMMFKRSTWEKLNKEDFVNTPSYIRRMKYEGVKLGVKKVEERLTYTHASEGFIHIGNLFPYYVKLEDLGEWDFTSKIDRTRFGYFLYQKKRFNITYGGDVELHLSIISQAVDTNKCIAEWLELVKGYYG
jgi:hypothetical protein